MTNSTFANVALSSRLSQNPLRFYASGRESVYNMWQLVHEIKNGEHPLFKEDTSINLFAYSIGALLSQVKGLSPCTTTVTTSKRTPLFGMRCSGAVSHCTAAWRRLICLEAVTAS